jgi:hypothetical protein
MPPEPVLDFWSILFSDPRLEYLINVTGLALSKSYFPRDNLMLHNARA